jgi:hypothetical protein
MINTDHILPVSMTPVEQQEIYDQLNRFGPESKLVEWGSGGSTVLWYTNLKPLQKLVSIENDPVWAQKIQEKIPGHSQFTYRVYETVNDGATFTPENDYYQDYVQGPPGIWDADIYLVDGRVRIWCAKNIFEKAQNRQAVVYCHDYAYNGGHYDQLLSVYPRSEIIPTPGTPYMMLKLWMT